MKAESVERALEKAEAALGEGRGLEGTGFWQAVSHLRRDPSLARHFADKVGEIDQRAFEAAVRLRVPAWAGTLLLSAGSLLAIGVLLWLPKIDGTWRTLGFLGAFGALDVTTHSLAHFIAGKVFGISFTHYFLGGPPPPRPGAKTNYASYLRTPPRRRAAMHASGAIVTKIVPFALIPVAFALEVEWWGLAILVLVGIFQIATDVLFSTKTSDWKKVLRELRAAREATGDAG